MQEIEFLKKGDNSLDEIRDEILEDRIYSNLQENGLMKDRQHGFVHAGHILLTTVF